jgi:hypothetical protein
MAATISALLLPPLLLFFPALLLLAQSRQVSRQSSRRLCCWDMCQVVLLPGAVTADMGGRARGCLLGGCCTRQLIRRQCRCVVCSTSGNLHRSCVLAACMVAEGRCQHQTLTCSRQENSTNSHTEVNTRMSQDVICFPGDRARPQAACLLGYMSYLSCDARRLTKSLRESTLQYNTHHGAGFACDHAASFAGAI